MPFWSVRLMRPPGVPLYKEEDTLAVSAGINLMMIGVYGAWSI